MPGLAFRPTAPRMTNLSRLFRCVYVCLHMLGASRPFGALQKSTCVSALATPICHSSALVGDAALQCGFGSSVQIWLEKTIRQWKVTFAVAAAVTATTWLPIVKGGARQPRWAVKTNQGCRSTGVISQFKGHIHKQTAALCSPAHAWHLLRG